MRYILILMTVFVIAGCLATDPAAREARRQETAAFAEAVSSLFVLDESYTSKLKCRPLGQVTGRGGMVPRSYDGDMQHAIEMAKQAAVRAGGNALLIVSSQLSAKFPREVIVIARAFDCRLSGNEKARPASGANKNRK